MTVTSELNDWYQRNYAAPRYRYYQRGRGPMFCWTTERFEELYASFILKPVGTGSRSGKAVEWECDEDSISSHKLRKDAKARALKLYTEAEASE